MISYTSGDVVVYETVDRAGKWKWTLGVVRSHPVMDTHRLTEIENWKRKPRDLSGEEKKKAEELLTQIIEAQRDAELKKRKAFETADEIRAKAAAVAEQRNEVTEKIDVAKIQLTEARQAVLQIDENQMREIRSYRIPPAAVRLVLDAVLAVITNNKYNPEKTAWDMVLTRIREKSFQETVAEFNSNVLTKDSAKTLMGYLANKQFTLDNAVKASKATGPLYLWVAAQGATLEAHNAIRRCDENVKGLESQLTVLNALAVKNALDLKKVEESIRDLEQRHEDLLSGDIYLLRSLVNEEMNGSQGMVLQGSLSVKDFGGTIIDTWNPNDKPSPTINILSVAIFANVTSESHRWKDAEGKDCLRIPVGTILLLQEKMLERVTERVPRKALDDVKAQLEAMSQREADLKAALNAKDDELKSQQRSAKAIDEETTQQNEHLVKALRELDEHRTKFSDLEGQLAARSNKLSARDAELARITASLAANEGVISKLNKEVAALMEEVGSSSRNGDTLQERNTKLRDELEALRADHTKRLAFVESHQKEAIDQLEGHLLSLQIEKQQSDADGAAKQKQLDALNRQIKDTQSSLDKTTDELVAKAKALTVAEEEHQAEGRKSAEAITKLEADLKETSNKLTVGANQLGALSEERNALQSRVQTIEAERSREVQMAADTERQLKVEIQQLSDQVVQRQREVDEGQTTRDSLTKELTAALKELTHQLAIVSNLELRNTQLQTEVKAAEEQFKASLASQDSHINEQSAAMKHLQNQLAQSVSEVLGAQQQLRLEKAACSNLVRERDTAAHKHNQQYRDLNEELDLVHLEIAKLQAENTEREALHIQAAEKQKRELDAAIADSAQSRSEAAAAAGLINELKASALASQEERKLLVAKVQQKEQEGNTYAKLLKTLEAKQADTSIKLAMAVKEGAESEAQGAELRKAIRSLQESDANLKADSEKASMEAAARETKLSSELAIAIEKEAVGRSEMAGMQKKLEDALERTNIETSLLQNRLAQAETQAAKAATVNSEKIASLEKQLKAMSSSVNVTEAALTKRSSEHDLAQMRLRHSEGQLQSLTAKAEEQANLLRDLQAAAAVSVKEAEKAAAESEQQLLALQFSMQVAQSNAEAKEAAMATEALRMREKLDGELSKARADNDLLTKKFAQMESQTVSKSAFTALERKNAELEAALATSKRDASSVSDALGTVRKERDSLTRQLEEATRSQATKTRVLEGKVEVLERKFTDQNKKSADALEAARRKHGEENSTWDAQKKDLKIQIGNLESIIEQLQTDGEDAKELLIATREELDGERQYYRAAEELAANTERTDNLGYESMVEEATVLPNGTFLPCDPLTANIVTTAASGGLVAIAVIDSSLAEINVTMRLATRDLSSVSEDGGCEAPVAAEYKVVIDQVLKDEVHRLTQRLLTIAAQNDGSEDFSAARSARLLAEQQACLARLIPSTCVSSIISHPSDVEGQRLCTFTVAMIMHSHHCIVSQMRLAVDGSMCAVTSASFEMAGLYQSAIFVSPSLLVLACKGGGLQLWEVDPPSSAYHIGSTPKQVAVPRAVMLPLAGSSGSASKIPQSPNPPCMLSAIDGPSALQLAIVPTRRETNEHSDDAQQSLLLGLGPDGGAALIAISHANEHPELVLVTSASLPSASSWMALQINAPKATGMEAFTPACDLVLYTSCRENPSDEFHRIYCFLGNEMGTDNQTDDEVQLAAVAEKPLMPAQVVAGGGASTEVATVLKPPKREIPLATLQRIIDSIGVAEVDEDDDEILGDSEGVLTFPASDAGRQDDLFARFARDLQRGGPVANISADSASAAVPRSVPWNNVKAELDAVREKRHQNINTQENDKEPSAAALSENALAQLLGGIPSARTVPQPKVQLSQTTSVVAPIPVAALSSPSPAPNDTHPVAEAIASNPIGLGKQVLCLVISLPKSGEAELVGTESLPPISQLVPASELTLMLATSLNGAVNHLKVMLSQPRSALVCRGVDGHGYRGASKVAGSSLYQPQQQQPFAELPLTVSVAVVEAQVPSVANWGNLLAARWQCTVPRYIPVAQLRGITVVGLRRGPLGGQNAAEDETIGSMMSIAQQRQLAIADSARQAEYQRELALVSEQFQRISDESEQRNQHDLALAASRSPARSGTVSKSTQTLWAPMARQSHPLLDVFDESDEEGVEVDLMSTDYERAGGASPSPSHGGHPFAQLGPIGLVSATPKVAARVPTVSRDAYRHISRPSTEGASTTQATSEPRDSMELQGLEDRIVNRITAHLRVPDAGNSQSVIESIRSRSRGQYYFEN